MLGRKFTVKGPYTIVSPTNSVTPVSVKPVKTNDMRQSITATRRTRLSGRNRGWLAAAHHASAF
jgi:hypothetical protein